jgi:hypothetical protein
MSEKTTVKGKIVEAESLVGEEPSPTAGLYLVTEDGEQLALIAGDMYTMVAPDILHRESRPAFEPFLDQTVEVNGLISGHTIWSAAIEKPDK